MIEQNQLTLVNWMTSIIIVLLTLGPPWARSELCEDIVCKYRFVIRHRRTMTFYQNDYTFPVISNGTRLTLTTNGYIDKTDPRLGSTVNPDDVITADGVSRDVITINEQFPGPTIEVLRGSRVRP
jgi:hypothetical protein